MTTTGNHVIFIHPDGTSPSHFAFARFVDLGPDGRLNWDNLDHTGVYLGHMEDQLSGTSNGGAVTHATGAKVFAESFGFEADGSPIVSLSGTNKTIVEEARDAGKVTALVQSGGIFEPGTAAFVAKTAEINVDGNRVPPRSQAADIAKQVIESGVDFIMGGGELNLLPVGTDGFHGTAEEYDALSTNPLFRPSENLIDLAVSLGYTVVYTEEQLNALLDLPTPPTKVLGVFAPIHTFNDRPEEVLAERGLPLYVETAPTIGEMLEVTQALMKMHPNFDNGSIAIVEEEGTDNFGNNNNASGSLEALRRADEAIGVALDFVEENPNTLIITAADSEAGGLQVRDPLPADQTVGTINNNPTTESRPVPMDGVEGADTLPFTSAPDANGDVFNFGIAWAGTPDFGGSIVSKAHGLNAEKLPATLDNTKIYELMYETLFEVELEARNPDPTPAPQATANTGNVIFIHPDGTSPSHFMAARNIDLGPDGRLNWDMMSDAGVYLGHMDNRLTGTSNGGAVTHANGVKVFNESFGLDADNNVLTPASGVFGKTIFEEAIDAGKATALIQSGHMAEPGTAAFVAETTNRDGNDLRARDKYAEITEQVIRSGTTVIMGAGELYMLPQGTTGFHVTAEMDANETRAERRPTINLIELAESLGYTVVYTEEQMFNAVNQATPPEKLLGVFAATNTYDARSEETLGLNTENPLPLYVETAPTVGEMLEASLVILQQDPDGFFVVVEEEGTDNFGNINNAPGTIEAVRRTDEAIGVAMNYVDTQDPNTLVLTAADSEAGGLQVFQFAPYNRPSGNITSEPAIADEEAIAPFVVVNPTTTRDNVAVLDGANGSTGSEENPWIPFSAQSSIDGPMGNFGVTWSGTPDVPGAIVSKAYGMNADLLPSTLDNTEIYKLMYQTLFGELPTGKFNRISSFVVASQIEINSNTDLETAAEIVASSTDGNTLIYSNSPQGTVGFVDITDPSNPQPLGEVDVDGEPTSVTVKGNYALVAVNTSENFVNPSGQLRAIDLETQTIMQSWDIGGQPDSIAVSPDGNYAVIAIENERDEDLGDGGLPQLPAGFVVIVDTSDAELNNWTTTAVDLTNLAGVTVPEDPEPEFVDINSNNIAAITLQENNAIVLIDLATATVIRSFSAGLVDLTNIDTVEDDVINQTSSLNDVPREPDGITFIGTDYIATADEGDWNGGSRGFTIYDLEGNVVYTSGSELDNIAAQVGHYPEARSENKGNEPENIEFATYNGTDYLFVNSERSSLVFVYNVDDPTNPQFVQVLPAGVAPEGGKAIPERNLLVVASEEDSRGDKIRSVINIYEMSGTPAMYPTLQSVNGANGVPIPWSAMSGLTAGDGNTLYAVEDSFYNSNRFFTIDTSTTPATLTTATTIKDTNGIFAALEPDLVNPDNTVNIDPEGIADTGNGSLWIASEGAGAAGDEAQILNYLFKVNANDGAIEEVVTLPDEINAKQIRFGLEGVAYDNGQLVVVLQRAWTDDPNPRVLVYDTNTSEWVGDYFYPLDAVESQNGGWVGLSDISPLGNGNFLVLERDNQGGPDAAIKRLYSINLSEAENGDTLEKQFVRDLIPDFTATGGLMPEKLEGLAVTDDTIWVINDNDGVDDNSGETQLVKLDFIFGSGILNLNLVGTYATGKFDEGAAEIPAFDPSTNRLFVVNAESVTVDVLDLSDPSNPVKIGEIDASALGGVANSVAVKNGIVAIALEASVKTDNGSVVFFNSNSDFSIPVAPVNTVEVGALPDMVTFTPDGMKILTANEGEPNDDYSIDPEGSISIIDISTGVENATVTNANFNAFDAQKDALIAQGVRIFGLDASVSQDLEPEYIAFSGDSQVAYVILQENNALAVVDITTGTVSGIVPLGFKDHSLEGNALDASNRDDAINITNWPVFGMYQPDAIASYEVNGQTYIVSANEGDSRDYDGFSEEDRVNDLTLDPVAFPNAGRLQEDEQLGRLNITNTLGDTDGDGDFDQLYSYGARSFSIWDSNGNLVFDSGDDFERIVAQQIPDYFNSNNDDNDSFDSRSDDKGPEPEGVVVGEINGVPYAFIGLERVGGIMVYDISDPTDAQFVQYINNRDFTVDAQLEDGSSNPDAGDLGPEGLVFISAEDSPNGVPLLVVSNEVSGSTSIYEIEAPTPEPFTLQLLHASDQEAGIPALQDAIGFSAVLNALDAQYENTLKLSSGDLFIAGPFFNASQDIYGRQGIADILIQNELGWDAAAVGNHEFDAGTSAFYNAIAPNASIQGTGIDPTTGFTGASFPYLATNLDYSTDSSNLKNLVVDSGEAPKPASLTESVVVDVNGEQIGVIGAVVPYLPQIANIGGITMLTDPNSRDIETNAQLIADSVQPFVDELVAQGVNKIVLMTHLQQFEIEQALASKLSNVDILMGGGSHRVMGNDDDVLREDETQVPPELLQPYPQVFQDADGNDIYLINTAANYRYVGQLIVDFDGEGNILSVGDESGTFATDIAGVDRLYEEDITTFDQVKAVADAELVEIVDGVGEFINSKDSNLFGNTEVWLNGLRSSVRTEETNLGNLTADANLWYAEQYGFDIDISVKNGGGIRDQIGVSFIDGGTNELIQLPPQANPAVGKEEGDVSQLDIENSLRFDNKLSVADISAQGIKDLAEHFVAQWAPGTSPGQFGQIGGFSFSFDPDNTPIEFTRDENSDATGVATPGERIQNLVLNREDGTQEAIVLDGELVVDPDTTYKMVILDFLAGGGDGYPIFYFENVVRLDSLNPEGLPNNSDLPIAGEQDALAEYLAEFFPDATQAFDEADTPIEQDTRIQNLDFRDDSLLDNPVTINIGNNGGTFNFGDRTNDLVIVGGDGEDNITTGSGNDRIDPAGGNNIVNAGAGDDEIIGSGLPDVENQIDGGEGNDTVIYDGAFAEFPISVENGVVTVGTNTDTLTNVEQLQFSDRTVLVEDLVLETLLNDPLTRFQNSDRPGTFLFAGKEESDSIRQNFPQFVEEGFAFNVSEEADDRLIRFNRFQNSDLPGTYLFAGEEESDSIRQNYPQFVNEGIAFYALSADADLATDIYRFQNTEQPGSYIFVAEEERDSILANFPQFTLEGVAFEVAI